MLIIPNAPRSEYIDREDDIKTVLEEIEKRGIFSFDTETDGIDIIRSRPILFSIAFGSRRITCPIKVIPLFSKVFSSRRIVKIGANIKFDMHMLSHFGIDVHNIADVMVMAHMENNERLSYSIKKLSSYLFSDEDPRHINYKTPFKGRIKGIQKFIDEYGFEAACDYASLDAWTCLVLYEELQRRLKELRLWNLFEAEDKIYTEILFDMEHRGFLIDIGYLKELRGKCEKKLDEVKGYFARKAGRPINLNSVPQLQEFFYGYLKKEISKRTKKGGKGSIDEETLRKWASVGDEFAKILLEYRRIMKLYSTYVEGLLKVADSNGRVHSTFHQIGTRTGRLSSSDPNLQNIPKDDDFGIRKAFITESGWVIIDCDYSQIEQVLITLFSKDEFTLRAICDGKDLHSITAAMMFDIDYDEIVRAKKKSPSELTEKDKELLRRRYESKTIGFGLNYGEGPNRLSIDLNCSIEEAVEKIDRYFSIRPRVKEYIDKIVKFSEKEGYVTTLAGRRQMMSLAAVPGPMRKSYSKNAVNYVIQGSAADIIKQAMILLYNNSELRNLGARMLSQVHDELIFECPAETASQALGIIKEKMKEAHHDRLKKYLRNMGDLKDRFSLEVEGGIGNNWLEAKR
uniref:DNA polymerase I n=1 Tax=Dictyoglomus turgidum TaxID=513050 RepID=A0A7C3WP09_9BACT